MFDRQQRKKKNKKKKQPKSFNNLYLRLKYKFVAS